MQVVSRAEIPGAAYYGDRCAGSDFLSGLLKEFVVVLVDGDYVIVMLDADRISCVIAPSGFPPRNARDIFDIRVIPDVCSPGT